MIEANFTLIVLPIKGVGVFSNAYFEEEEFIGEYVESRASKLGRKLTATLWESDPLGRFCNHSERPNTTLVKTENGYNLYANRPIDRGDEITVSYHVVEYKLERPKGEYFKSNFVNRDYKNYGKSICEY
jgi:hypothetical protein